MNRYRKARHRFRKALHIVFLIGGLLLISATIARVSIALSSANSSSPHNETIASGQPNQSQEENLSLSSIVSDVGAEIPTAISLRQGAVRGRYPVAAGLVGLILAGLALSGLTAAVLSRRDERSGS